VIAYLGQFFGSSPNFLGPFSTEKVMYILILKKGVLEIFSQTHLVTLKEDTAQCKLCHAVITN
jgi:hypothetical protein